MRKFRRLEALGSREFRRAFLSISGAREPLTGLGWELGQRSIDWDRCGGLGGRTAANGLGKLFRAEGEGERIGREERGENNFGLGPNGPTHF
ncbi:hypothetical protein ACLB2K_037369 [Fragaria x ananassa]